MWYVYFLELSNNDIYVGSTDDLKRRFHSHEQGYVLSTQKFLPLKLKAYVAVGDERTARRLERYFKSGSGKAFANKRFLRSAEVGHEATAKPTLKELLLSNEARGELDVPARGATSPE